METKRARRPPVIKLEDDDDSNKPLELSALREVIDLIAGEDEDSAAITLDDDDSDVERELSPGSMQTEYHLPAGCDPVPSVVWNRMTLQPGAHVELRDKDFMRIHLIFYDRTNGRTSLMGNLLRRNNRMDCMLEKKLNELCLIAQTPSDKQNFKLSDCLVIRELRDVVCIREIIATNHDWPGHNWSQTANPEDYAQTDDWKRKNLRLVVRWLKIEETSGTKIVKQTLRRLNQQECDDGLSVDLTKRLREFLGNERLAKVLSDVADEDADEDELMEISQPVAGPSKRTAQNAGFARIERKLTETLKSVNSAGERIVERRTSKTTIKTAFATSKPQHRTMRATENSRTNTQRGEHKYPYLRYTKGEGCAGGGGWACGARQAGLKHLFLVDNWDIACETLRKNGFGEGGTKIIHKDLQDFVINGSHYVWEVVDILHISYPCTPHSWANTRGGPKDEAALDLIMSLSALLDRCKPRVVTLEQVNAITQRRNGAYFKLLVNQLTSKGYSVSWKVENFAEVGNPQARGRLMMTATCPGEELPPSMPATHGLGPGMKQFVTIKNVLDKIANFRGRVPEIMKYAIKRNGAPFNPNIQKKGLITGSGGLHALHPCGERDYNLQEFAAFQTFPLHHKFAGSIGDIRLQIGNAVPPVGAKAYLENIVRSLQKSDRRIAAWEEEIIEIMD
jgi:DNA (cytosine-5)-methyltransferase 1